jgi:NAD(P)-dependent dehydrogenase (short-subunit alcohol dehydrogenase family)
MKLENKVIVITGSTRGIGRAVAEACAREGGNIVVSSRSDKAVKEAVTSLVKEGFTATGIVADVSRESDIKNLVDHAIKTFGKIDVWINNAGLSGGYRMLYDVGEDEICDIVNANLTGTLQACRLVIPYFMENKGIIINMSGKGGRGDASPYMTVYAATKAAVTSLTKSLAKEYKRFPVSIHCVFPGMVETDFYKDLKVSSNLAHTIKDISVALKVFGVPINEVAEALVDICAQEPGKKTGNLYSIAGKTKMMKAVLTMIWYRMTGKLSQP